VRQTVGIRRRHDLWVPGTIAEHNRQVEAAEQPGQIALIRRDSNGGGCVLIVARARCLFVRFYISLPHSGAAPAAPLLAALRRFACKKKTFQEGLIGSRYRTAGNDQRASNDPKTAIAPTKKIAPGY
jgi:hypothetical protein